MQVIQHKAAARGVSQLMYVGDDQAVEQATGVPTLVKVGVVLVIGWLLFARGR
jgi:hypothetical protein